MSLLKVAGTTASSGTLYVDDVFSTYLYTGTGAAQTITNGIDLAGKGGLVWIKSRNNSTNHKLIDSAQASSSTNWDYALVSNSTASAIYAATGIITTQTTGFRITSPDNGFINENTYTYASWTFRKSANFFDVVTYTGTGSARTIAHSLGVAPGMIIVKRTDTTSNWQVYSNGLTSAAYSMQLNLTAAQASAPTVWNSTAPTSSVFSVGTDATVNASGGTYVAYLFAHDTSSTGIIQCGSYTGNGSSDGPVINLGYEPQWVMIKRINAIGNWQMHDVMRDMSVTSYAQLQANLSSAESANVGSGIQPQATGFKVTFTGTDYNASGSTYIYMAIRRPNKPPTSGTQVYYSSLGTGGTPGVVSGFPPDLAIGDLPSNGGTYPYFPIWTDRLRGNNNSLVSSSTVVESSPLSSCIFYQTGFGTSAWNSVVNAWLFKRAPGFFDEVCYTGTGVATTQAHNLTVVPELMIVKERSAVNNWWVYVSSVGNTKYSVLNSTAIPVTSSTAWNNTTPTASVFSIGTGANVNASAQTFVAYLFATLAGISKVGSYTGNGSSQNIECGFAAGARFFLVKATSTTGSWWVWDSARGITSGNDPALQLNSTAAEITTADAVDPYSPGITVNQEATCSINANGVSYIFLAVA